MRNFMEACVNLRQVERALTFDARGVALTPDVKAEVEKMKKYLEKLVTEFQVHYKDLSIEQLGYEARLKATSENTAPDRPQPPARSARLSPLNGRP